jgi:hypothetical protein
MSKSMVTCFTIWMIAPKLNNSDIFTPGMAPACLMHPFQKHYKLNALPVENSAIRFNCYQVQYDLIAIF